MKQNSSPLYIYNPFDVTLNVSKNITIFELTRLIEHFRKALQILIESNEENAIIELINLNSLISTQIDHIWNYENNTKLTEINNIKKNDIFEQREFVEKKSLNESINKVDVNILKTIEKNIIK